MKGRSGKEETGKRGGWLGVVKSEMVVLVNVESRTVLFSRHPGDGPKLVLGRAPLHRSFSFSQCYQVLFLITSDRLDPWP